MKIYNISSFDVNFIYQHFWENGLWEFIIDSFLDFCHKVELSSFKGFLAKSLLQGYTFNVQKTDASCQPEVDIILNYSTFKKEKKISMIMIHPSTTMPIYT